MSGDDLKVALLAIDFVADKRERGWKKRLKRHKHEGQKWMEMEKVK